MEIQNAQNCTCTWRDSESDKICSRHRKKRSLHTQFKIAITAFSLWKSVKWQQSIYIWTFYNDKRHISIILMTTKTASNVPYRVSPISIYSLSLSIYRPLPPYFAFSRPVLPSFSYFAPFRPLSSSASLHFLYSFNCSRALSRVLLPFILLLALSLSSLTPLSTVHTPVSNSNKYKQPKCFTINYFMKAN